MTAPPDQLDSWLSWIDDLPLPEIFNAGQDALQDFIVAAIAVADDRLLTLSDPNAVHLNMLRGTIAKPSLAQIAHIYGDEWTAAIAAAEARGREQGLREAADALDKKHRGDLPDHIKSEDGEFVRALIPAPKEKPEGYNENEPGDFTYAGFAPYCLHGTRRERFCGTCAAEAKLNTPADRGDT